MDDALSVSNMVMWPEIVPILSQITEEEETSEEEVAEETMGRNFRIEKEISS